MFLGVQLRVSLKSYGSDRGSISLIEPTHDRYGTVPYPTFDKKEEKRGNDKGRILTEGMGKEEKRNSLIEFDRMKSKIIFIYFFLPFYCLFSKGRNFN